MREKLAKLLANPKFEYTIIVLVVINAIILGMETSSTLMAKFGPTIIFLDDAILSVFVVELLMRIYVFRGDFFKAPWRVFDFIVVTVALIPATGSLSVLRALRVLRILRLLSVIPSLRKVITGLVTALPGLGSIGALMILFFYVFSVMATKLFSAEFPQWFGSLGTSAYSLFQIMTLESWSMGIVRPVMEKFPFAWVFFIAFIMSTTFTVLNLFIGIIVTAMQSEHEAAAADERDQLHAEQEDILAELRGLRKDLAVLRKDMSGKK